MSIYQIFGIPTEVGSALFLVALGLTLSPYLGGLEAGPIKIPALPPDQGRKLQLGGPALLLLSIGLFVPFLPITSPGAMNGHWVLIDTVDETGRKGTKSPIDRSSKHRQLN